MIMKWNPIVNGDLSKVPRDEDVIFTSFNEKTGEYYAEIGVVNEFSLGLGYVNVGSINVPVEIANIKAWMEIPEPFKPGRCDICKHWEEWTDNFGDRYSKCELFDNVPFSQIISSESCPIDKEISDGSN